MSTISSCIKTTGDSKWKRKKRGIIYKSNKIQILELNLKELKIKGTQEATATATARERERERSSVESNIILGNNSNEVRRPNDVYNSSSSNNTNISRSVL